MGHIVQRLVRNAIMQAVNQVIQNKTQQEAAKFGNEWKGSFHCLVSGYYSGMTVKYLMLPFAVFCILCAIGSGIAGGLTYSIWFLVIAVVCLVTRSYGMKMMRVIIYWDNGMAFYDKDGNEVWLTGANWFGFNCGENCLHYLWSGDVDDMLSEVADRGTDSHRADDGKKW